MLKLFTTTTKAVLERLQPSLLSPSLFKMGMEHIKIHTLIFLVEDRFLF